MQSRTIWSWLALAGLAGCGAEPTPATPEPPQPTVLARYDGNIEYTFDEGSASSSPEHAAATVKVVESHQQLYVEFETKAWFLVGVVWQMTDLPPDRFGLTPLKPASNRTCPVNSWTAQGSADLTLNHAQVAISGRVQGDDCEEDFDRQMFITFSGDVVR